MSVIYKKEEYEQSLTVSYKKNMAKSKAETRTEERWVNIADVADHIGVSQDTIRNWLKSGKLPTIKAGKQYKFLLSEVDALLRDGKLAEEDSHVGKSKIGD